MQVRSSYGNYGQYRLIPNTNYLPVFSSQEKEIIDDVLERLSDANAKDISEYSHGDLPWIVSNDMDIISKELAYKRQYPYSILAREQKKQEAYAQIQASNIFSDIAEESDAYEKYR